MLYNFDWLTSGAMFPPITELGRLKGYKDNSALFEDNSELVLKPYKTRLMSLINAFKDSDLTGTTFYDTPAYWQLSTIKTVDLMIGDAPTVICSKNSDKIAKVIQDSNFFEKLNELVIDNDSLGECLIRPYINSKGERDFVAQSPLMWFPVVNPENVKEVIADTLCWTVCVFQDANHPERNKYELHAKLQRRGSYEYEFRRYKVTSWEKVMDYIHRISGEHYGEQFFYYLGSLIERKIVKTEFDQLVIQIAGITTSRTLHGISNYERITALVAELGVRESLGNFILDQNAIPRMAAPDSAFVRDKNGQWKLKTGGRSFVVAPGAQVPVYVTWDGNLTANEIRIAEIKKTLYSMCEMGSVVNNDEINSSQGYQALEVKLTSPKAKVRRMASKFQAPLKKLLKYLLNDDSIEETDITIIFNEGIPTSEEQNNNLAQQKRNIGFSFRSVAKEYYGLDDEQAEKEWELFKEEQADSFMEQFAQKFAQMQGGFNGQYGNENAGDDKTFKGDEDNGKTAKNGAMKGEKDNE